MARLCVRLGEPDGPLAASDDARAKTEQIVDAVRAGADETRLTALLDQLDGLLRQAGHAAGLGAYRTSTGTSPPSSGYDPLGGLDEHPMVEVLVCPSERRCRRQEIPELGARSAALRCQIHDASLRSEHIT